jgi:mannose-1-phosphate guanylyltransferase
MKKSFQSSFLKEWGAVMGTHLSADNLWSVVLAGGEGERTRPFIERWLGYHLPKQFCSFVGTRSMLQHTWDRADRLTCSGRKVTVMAKQHHGVAWRHIEQQGAGKVIFQPHNCDTAAGIFLPLTYVRAWDPEAMVVLFPSDHFIFPEDRFLTQVRRAAHAANWLGDRLVLLGVTPTNMELEYGWIEPGENLGVYDGTVVKEVKTFLEKPDHSTALEAFSKGALWNTMVLTGKVDTFWNLGWKCFPELMVRFEQLQEAIGTSRESPTLEAIYENMPQRNFSSDLLQKTPEHIGVIQLEGVMWSDWGYPARIAETLCHLGKKPSFEREHLLDSDPLDIPEQQIMEVK